MVRPSYIFKLAIGDNTPVAINPHYSKLEKKYAKESGQEFFRKTLEGKITLHWDDYELVKNARLSDTIKFYIYKDGSQQPYYVGEFNKTDCKFNHAKKSCEITLSNKDEYTKVLNAYENTYDLVKLAPALTSVALYKRSLVQVYIAGSNTISNFFGGTYWEAEVAEAVEDSTKLTNTYKFARLEVGNEFSITDADESGVNGVYAGINGEYISNGAYTARIIFDTTPNLYRLIIRNTAGAEVYTSENFTVESSSRKYLPFTNIPMYKSSDRNYAFTIQTPIMYDIYQRFLCDVDSMYVSGSFTKTFDLPVDDIATDNRNFKKCLNLITGDAYITPETVTTPTKYGINDFGRYFTSAFIPATAGIGRAMPICRSTWANASLWYTYSDTYQSFEGFARKEYTIKDTYALSDVIKVLLSKIDDSLTHEATPEYSNFLYGTTNPVYGQKFTVVLAQKTNILKGNYDQPAQKAEITLKALMDMLSTCFRCYWYIEDGKFKIEHIKFFKNGKSYTGQPSIQLNLSNVKDQFNSRKGDYFQSDVEYDKTDLTKRYEFDWADDSTELFGPMTIDVNAAYIQEDKNESLAPDMFSSDVDFMLFNSSSFSEDGFALLCPIKSGSRLVLPIVSVDNMVDENGNTYPAAVQNYYASWPYLAWFYMYDMPANTIEPDIVRNDYTVFGIKDCMQQKISFFAQDDIDELKLITTSVGNGKILEASINIDTRLVDATISFEPK